MSGLIAVPAHLAPYVDALGIDGAIAFFLEFGGAELYLPRRPQPRGRLARLVGVDGAARLAELAEHLPRRVPLAKPWIAQVWKSRGLPTAEIARRLHASDVAVRGWLKKGRRPGDQPRQLSLI